MAIHKTNNSQRVGCAHEILSAGGPYDLTARTGRPGTCVRRVHCYNAATITALEDSRDNDSAPGAVPEGTVFDGDFSSITFTGGPIMVQW